MSGNQDRSPQRLAAELAETPCAVPVLVTLLEHDGSASCATLRRSCPSGTDDALRWLTAVHLVRPSHADGTLDFDRPEAVYELTAIGTSLTRSLTELAEVLGGSRRPDRVPAATGEPRQ